MLQMYVMYFICRCRRRRRGAAAAIWWDSFDAALSMHINLIATKTLHVAYALIPWPRYVGIICVDD